MVEGEEETKAVKGQLIQWLDTGPISKEGGSKNMILELMKNGTVWFPKQNRPIRIEEEDLSRGKGMASE